MGRAYLADDVRAAPGAERLGRLLSAAWDEGAQPLLRLALAAELQRSWRDDDVVLVEGWVLARVEADLCALAAQGG